jgi:hypothetical protein
MGAKDTMKTFFTAMNEAVVPTRGYGPKIISTPMGPFTWNDNLNAWVNSNNGMQMNNIAFQDMYAMMDYGTASGDSGSPLTSSPSSPTINTLNFSPTTQNFDNLVGGDIAITPTFTITGNTVPVALKWNIVTGSFTDGVIKYKKNGGVTTTWNENTSTGAVTFSAGDTLQMFANVQAALVPDGATIRLSNVTDSNAICSNTLTANIVASG